MKNRRYDCAGVDEETATIRVDGGFHLDETPRIQTADCMGRLQKTFSLERTAVRRYRIVDNGDFVGVKNFTPTIVEKSATCPVWFNVKGHNNAPLSRDRYCHCRSLSVDTSAPDLLSLVSAIVGSHAENDGNPQTTLTMSINPSADAGVSVAMELHGIEDDAVKGKRYRGTAVRKKEAGDLPNLSRNIYAPEARAGQWPKEECD